MPNRKKEFYQLLIYNDDVDLNKKLKALENFYNFNRSHEAFIAKISHETCKCL